MSLRKHKEWNKIECFPTILPDTFNTMTTKKNPFEYRSIKLLKQIKQKVYTYKAIVDASKANIIDDKSVCC